MKIRILFVEDDRYLNKLISYIFETALDFSLFIAETEYSALEILDTVPLDGVITDLQLNSHEGGVSVLESAVSRDLPVAIMTADVSRPDDYYFERGAKIVIRKPFDTATLPDIARELVNRDAS